MPDTVLEVAEPHCATELMDDEVVALNVETGVYFSIRELGVPLWTDLVAGHSVEALASAMQDAQRSDTAVGDFVSQLLHHGLMRLSTKQRVAGRGAFVAGLEREKGQLILEVFEDMKDLILSDPIHDVDEQKGWPSPADTHAST